MITGYRNIDDSCEISADESIKIIRVLSSSASLTDSCSLAILASPDGTEDDDFDLHLKITKDSNVCNTGIGYIDPENPKIISLIDNREVICSFRIHLNIIEKLEETRGFKYLGTYWIIRDFCRNGRFCPDTFIFFMNTAEWWRTAKYNFLDLRPAINFWKDYSSVEYYV